eukprot:CAMPEP_0197889704 /NCGR_PEP_ID=MMETSP1439-20131203/24479_1 /TAXON_ID=66791 /ORGANISM="Gonyaulax spinifera, Strain CCMP409" /LENGTH=189 /DNA_ID=CAMNT_0043509689 /DNA_START=109 /DNA_END=678 /DNA_ORIENTATION=+
MRIHEATMAPPQHGTVPPEYACNGFSTAAPLASDVPIPHNMLAQRSSGGFAETLASTLQRQVVEVPSIGSLGHPFSCGPPCKFSRRRKGCRDGRHCPCCHLCKWARVYVRPTRALQESSAGSQSTAAASSSAKHPVEELSTGSHSTAAAFSSAQHPVEATASHALQNSPTSATDPFWVDGAIQVVHLSL